MGSPSQSFEFLEYAPRRFDGGPEVEWINWLEDQRKAVNVAMQSRCAIDEMIMTEKEHQAAMRTQYVATQTPPSSDVVHALAMLHQETVSKSILASVFTPIFNIGLAVCGLFVSTVLFNVLFRGLPSHRQQYAGQNHEVYAQSMNVLKHGIMSMVLTPFALVSRLLPHA